MKFNGKQCKQDGYKSGGTLTFINKKTGLRCDYHLPKTETQPAKQDDVSTRGPLQAFKKRFSNIEIPDWWWQQ
tara:strand:+ start:681 stop:899 length:219 start_codon:yes stop_codon:yes gene_type:complete